MKKFCLLICCTMLLCSCGYQTGVVQKADKAYLRFSGIWERYEITVRVDEREPFQLKPSDADDTLFEITSGKHLIKVSRNDKIVVDRVVFLEGQTTFEVKIP